MMIEVGRSSRHGQLATYQGGDSPTLRRSRGLSNMSTYTQASLRCASGLIQNCNSSYPAQAAQAAQAGEYNI